MFSGRLLIGCYVGGAPVIIRTYVGETSSTEIAAMPPEKRKKSTLKYTAYFVIYTLGSLSGISGPGEHL